MTKKKIVFWVVIFILQVALIMYLQDLHTSRNSVVPTPTPAPAMQLTAAEAKVVMGAIEVVRADVVAGRLKTTKRTIDALSSLIPEATRQEVLAEFGTPDMGGMRDALDILDGKVQQFLE